MKKVFLIICLLLTRLCLFGQAYAESTDVLYSERVGQALADSLNDNGRWIKQYYVVGAAPPTPPLGTTVFYFKTDGKPYSKDDAGTESDLAAGGGTIDGTGTTNELVYWVDSNTAGALAVATYPSLTELAYMKGVTSAIQTQLGLKAPKDSPVFTTAVTLPVGLTGVVRTDTGVVSVDTDVTDIVTAASLTASGKVELATTAEINTGTDTTRVMPIDQYVASNRNVRYPTFRVVGNTTDVTVATTVGGDWEVPYACTITGIGAYNDTAGVTGTMTIDVNKNGTTIMTTNKITIDTGEKTSRSAAVAPVLTTTALSVGDIITIDNDAIHTTAGKGETVWLSVRMD